MSTGGILVIGDQSVESRKVALIASTADVTAEESTSSASFVSLATTGPAVLLSPGVTQNHELLLSNGILGASAVDGLASVAVAGSAAQDVDGTYDDQTNYTSAFRGTRARGILALAQATGATHTMKYRSIGGSPAFRWRRLIGKAI